MLNKTLLDAVLTAQNNNEFTKNINAAYRDGALMNLQAINAAVRSHPQMAQWIQDMPCYKLAILANFTADNIISYLELGGLTAGFNVNVYYPGYNQYQFSIANTHSGLYEFKPDMILLLVDELSDLIDCQSTADAISRIRDFTGLYLELLTKLRSQTSAVIVINSMLISESCLSSFVDYESKQKLLLESYLLNQQLLTFSLNHPDVVFVDISLLLQNSKSRGFQDQELKLFAQINFTDSLLKLMADEVLKVISASSGRTKKCLVLDLDDTLWKGILGDDGIDGIEVSGSVEGDQFKQLQRCLKHLQDQGVLLAICSKNDWQNVQEAFTRKTEMVLQLADFIAVKANWDNKHENLKSIAQETNIATDALVFVDDNQSECAAIANYLPEVMIICAKDGPLLTWQKLTTTGCFNKLKLATEDTLRTQLYQTEAKRKSFIEAVTSIENLLIDLQIKVTLFKADSDSLPRIYQLCQRTNQFNLTTKRYTENQLQALVEDYNSEILAVKVEDRFGPFGIVAAAFLTINDKVLVVDNFLMSCRVFSKGIETALMQAVFAWARHKSLTTIRGIFIPTAKNYHVKNFYVTQGFSTEAIMDSHVSFYLSPIPEARYPEWLTVYHQTEEKIND